MALHGIQLPTIHDQPLALDNIERSNIRLENALLDYIASVKDNS